MKYLKLVIVALIVSALSSLMASMGVRSMYAQSLTYEFSGLRYTFPSVHSAGSLVNNGSGTLSWGSAVPAGMALFNTTGNCPAGWTESVAAAGRFMVARAAGGGIGSTVGTALTNAQNKTHGHSISSAGAHDHGGLTGLSNNNFQSDTFGGGLEWIPHDNHAHAISSGGAHDHGGVSGNASTSDVSPYIQYPLCVKN